MDPMNSIWYFLEFQRQSSPEKESAAEFSAEPELRPRRSFETWCMNLILPLFVFAAVVTFGAVCILCPTFLP
jgi:hypothetical protein